MQCKMIRFVREKIISDKKYATEKIDGDLVLGHFQLTLFDELPILKSSKNNTKDERRYYNVILEKDLLGNWVITCIHGRIGTQLGRIRQEWVSMDVKEGLEHFEKLCQRREKKRYKIASHRNYLDVTPIDIIHSSVGYACG